MNHEKIAAALHALADAFLEGGVETVGAALQRFDGVKKGGKKAAAAEPAAPTATPVAEQPAAPIVPAVTLKDVNALVLKVAAKNRDGALAILAKFKLTNTVGLPPEQWQAVYDAFEEEIAKQDAAAVQVQQASLV